MSKKALVVMAKRPFPGRTKTRLSPPFTLAEASMLYESILKDTLELARATCSITPCVAYAPADAATADYFRHLAPDCELVAQVGTTLGERLDAVMSGRLAAGYDQVVAMNSDSPTLPQEYLEDAFRRLDAPEIDVVLGPCEDGGYYLIGWKQPHPRLVRDVRMSTDSVLADTLTIANEEEITVSLLAPWYDIDNMADLHRIRHELQGSASGAAHTRRFLRQRLLKPERG